MATIRKVSLCAAILLYWILTVGGNPLKAQSLAFNQVKLVGSTPETVPAGKVWKVEQILPREIWIFNVNGSPRQYEIFVNGNSRFVGHSSWTDSNTNSTTEACVLMPFWLPAGTSLAVGTYIGEISVIEFNVVP